MAGVKGRSGGHNRRPIAEHLLAGTYRPARHGARAAALAALAVVQDVPAVPLPAPPDLLTTERSRELWRQTVAYYEGFADPTAALLLELALGALDRAEGCVGPERRRWQAFAVGVFKQLGLGGALP